MERPQYVLIYFRILVAHRVYFIHCKSNKITLQKKAGACIIGNKIVTIVVNSFRHFNHHEGQREGHPGGPQYQAL